MLNPEQIKAIQQRTGIKAVPSPTVPNRVAELDSAWGTTPKPEVPFYTAIKSSVDDFKKIGTDVSKAFSDVPKNAVEGSIDPKTGKSTVMRSLIAAPAAAGQALGNTVGGIARGVGSLLSIPVNTIIEGLKQDNPELIEKIKSSKGYQDIAQAFHKENLTPEASKLIDNLSAQSEKNPEITQSLKNAMEVILLGGFGAAEKQIVDKGKKVFNAIENTIPATKTVSEKVTQKTFEKSIEESKKILNPSQKYTPTEIERLRQKGEIKTKGKGIFKKEVADPKPNATNETLATLVEEGKISSKNLPSENTKIIKQEARINDANIDEIVNRPELNKPFTKSTVNKVFDTLENSAKKDLVFVADTTEEKIYRAVMGVAKEEIYKNPLNNSGLRKSIKAFNARMEEILGKDIYGGAEESIGKARLQAAKDVRKSLNDFLAENLESPVIKKDTVLSGKKVVNKLPASSEYSTGRMQGGNVYKQQLQREAQLLNAADEISYRTRGSLNKTEVKKWFDAHPNAKKALGYGAGLVGLKVGTDIITGN